MTTRAQEALLEQVIAEAVRDPDFGRALRRALDAAVPKRQRRRPPPAIDPFARYDQGGEPALRRALAALDVDQLKDIVAHHQMDRAKLAMKWQTPERLIDLIVAQTISRTHKGEAFLR
jgi:hypothetical protein